MAKSVKVLGGCLAAPFVLYAVLTICVWIDAARYNLPGEVLQSPDRPTRIPQTAFEVAETLDAYVQPRFEILRDRQFGQFRLITRKHAGIVQLKVESPEEKRLIANVNAANRDYAVCLLHCVPLSGKDLRIIAVQQLQTLYFNQQQVATDAGYPAQNYRIEDRTGSDALLNRSAVQSKAIAALPILLAGKEYRTTVDKWAVLMRPVLATKQVCISCHTNAKPDATLGVMVYMVGPVRGHAQHIPTHVTVTTR